MVRFFPARIMQSERSSVAVILAFSFLTGLLCGAVTAAYAEPSYLLMMRKAITSPVSIVVLLPAILLPLLFSAFAVYISQHWLMVPIAFLKAFSFGFLSCCFRLTNPHSGWLLQSLFLFTDCLSIPVLCWFWIRSCSKKFDIAAFSLAVISTVGVSLFDYQFISPFLASLLS